MQVGERIGPFLCKRALAEGSFGAVFLVHDLELRRDVALKVLAAPERRSLTRFEREAQALGRLNHPAIVRIHRAGELPDGRPFLALEWVAGQSLGERLRAGQRLSAAEVSALGVRLCGALEHAHGQGVLHRDLKPDNVLIDERGRPYLTDFGLTRLLDRESDLTAPGRMLGTPYYAAPEQLAGDRGLQGPGSDVYGLAATLFEAFTGKPPVTNEGRGLDDLVDRVVIEPAPLASSRRADGDPRLDGVFQRALAKYPRERPSSAAELARLLSEAVPPEPEPELEPESELESASEFEPEPESDPPAAPRSLVLAVAVASALAALGVGVWASGHLAPARTPASGPSLRPSATAPGSTPEPSPPRLPELTPLASEPPPRSPRTLEALLGEVVARTEPGLGPDFVTRWLDAVARQGLPQTPADLIELRRRLGLEDALTAAAGKGEVPPLDGGYRLGTVLQDGQGNRLSVGLILLLLARRAGLEQVRGVPAKRVFLLAWPGPGAGDWSYLDPGTGQLHQADQLLQAWDWLAPGDLGPQPDEAAVRRLLRGLRQRAGQRGERRLVELAEELLDGL